MWLVELVWQDCAKWFSGQYIKSCMCSALQQWCNNFWRQEWGGIIGFLGASLFQRSCLLFWFSRLFVKSCCVMWLSNRFSSYAAYMHEYSIIEREQHASALPFSLTPHSLNGESRDKETVFIAWKLFGTCEISQSGVKQLLSFYVYCYISCY